MRNGINRARVCPAVLIAGGHSSVVPTDSPNRSDRWALRCASFGIFPTWWMQEPSMRPRVRGPNCLGWSICWAERNPRLCVLGGYLPGFEGGPGWSLAARSRREHPAGLFQAIAHQSAALEGVGRRAALRPL